MYAARRVSYLREIAVKAKLDGSFSEEWSILRGHLSSEGALQLLPGQGELQKLKTWAEAHGLLMDFEVEMMGFISEVRSVTFRNEGQACVDEPAGQTSASEPRLTPDTASATGSQPPAPEDYFDWDAVDCR